MLSRDRSTSPKRRSEREYAETNRSAEGNGGSVRRRHQDEERRKMRHHREGEAYGWGRRDHPKEPDPNDSRERRKHRNDDPSRRQTGAKDADLAEEELAEDVLDLANFGVKEITEQDYL